ncbi:MAG: hypothetical protein WCG05_05335 [Alphaproteobacteria bacterium]
MISKKIYVVLASICIMGMESHSATQEPTIFGPPTFSQRFAIFSEKFGRWEKEIIKALPRKNTQEIIQYLLPEENDGFTCEEFLTSLKRISLDEAKNVAMWTKRLVNPKMTGRSYLTIFNALKDVPTAERKAVTDRIPKEIIETSHGREIADFIKNPQSLVVPNMTEEERDRVFAALTNIRDTERALLVEISRSLSKNNGIGSDYAAILPAMATAPSEEWRDIAEYVRSFSDYQLNGQDCATLIISISSIPFPQREFVIKKTMLSLKPPVDLLKIIETMSATLNNLKERIDNGGPGA